MHRNFEIIILIELLELTIQFVEVEIRKITKSNKKVEATNTFKRSKNIYYK